MYFLLRQVVFCDERGEIVGLAKAIFHHLGETLSQGIEIGKIGFLILMYEKAFMNVKWAIIYQGITTNE